MTVIPKPTTTHTYPARIPFLTDEPLMQIYKTRLACKQFVREPSKNNNKKYLVFLRAFLPNNVRDYVVFICLML